MSWFELLIIIGLFFILYIFWQGAAYVPIDRAKIEKILAMAQAQPGEKAVDLGSGDGRIIIALAQSGLIAHGYEINPLLIWWSRRKIKKLGLEDRAQIIWKSFWGVDLSQYDLIIVFGVDWIMPRLSRKLKKEMAGSSRAISYAFALPGWPPAEQLGRTFLYRKQRL